LLIGARSNSIGPNRLANATCSALLTGENQQRVVQPGAVERGEGRIADLGQSDAGHHRAERGVQRLELEGPHHCGLEDTRLAAAAH
jgi:hypothetical protein